VVESGERWVVGGLRELWGGVGGPRSISKQNGTYSGCEGEIKLSQPFSGGVAAM